MIISSTFRLFEKYFLIPFERSSTITSNSRIIEKAKSALFRLTYWLSVKLPLEMGEKQSNKEIQIEITFWKNSFLYLYLRETIFLFIYLSMASVIEAPRICRKVSIWNIPDLENLFTINRMTFRHTMKLVLADGCSYCSSSLWLLMLEIYEFNIIWNILFFFFIWLLNYGRKCSIVLCLPSPVRLCFLLILSF